jgi:hypothetical protein
VLADPCASAARYNRGRSLPCFVQPFGISPEFLGHLDKPFGGFGVLDGSGQSLGSVGLVTVVVGLGHGGTFFAGTNCNEKVRSR